MIAHFIDTHCHFDFPPFNSTFRSSLQQANFAGVDAMIIPAVKECYFQRISQLCRQNSMLYGALGLHPLYCQEHTEFGFTELNRHLALRDPKIVAVGEIGLDTFDPSLPAEVQLEQCSRQLELAKYYALPVILHSRRTHDALAKLLKQVKLPRTGIVHGFSGSFQQAMVFIKLGYWIGVGGVITYERARKTRQAVASLPLEWLVLETDAPDMPLAGHQGQINRPERIREVFITLCRLRKEPAEQIAKQLYHNSLTVFALSLEGKTHVSE